MALAVSTLGTDLASQTDSTSYTHTAVTPTANADLLVWVLSTIAAGGAEVPTLGTPSWLSGSWTQELSVIGSNDFMRLTLFSGKAVASPGSATLGITFVATHEGCICSITQITGATDPVIQTKDGSIDSASLTSASVTLDAALAGATSIMLACFCKNGNSAMTASGGETQISDLGHNSPVRRMHNQYEVNDTTSGVTWSGTDESVRTIAVEVSDTPTGRQPRYGAVNFQDPGVFAVKRGISVPKLWKPKLWLPERPSLVF